MRQFQETPTSLLTQCRNNLPEGWEKLRVLYGRLILYWCRQANISTEDQYDVYQEVMLSLVKGIHSFRKENPDDKFRKWLRTVTNSRIADFYRQHANDPRYLESLSRLTLENEEETDPAARIEENNILFQQLTELLKVHFSPQTIEAFRRMNQRGATSEEVARDLGMTATAVRAAKKRVFDQIKKQFGELL